MKSRFAREAEAQAGPLISERFCQRSARNGKVLYRFNTGGAIGGGVVTYEEGGKQYVAVMSGNPSSSWVDRYHRAPTVFLFALPPVK